MLAFLNITILVSILVFGFIYILIHRNRYKTDLNFLLLILMYFISILISFTLFNLSTYTIFNTPVALFIWKISLITNISSIGLLSSIHIIELHKESKYKFIPVIIYVFFGGVIFSLIFIPQSFFIAVIGSDLNYHFLNMPLLISILIFNFSIIITTWLSQAKGIKNFNDRRIGMFFNVFIMFYTLIILIYSLYLLFPGYILKIFYVLLFFVVVTYTLFVIIRNPGLFSVFTNSIYEFIIFHKSGILLYSYNFQTEEEVDDSLLKGSILIGINHILSNFSNMKNQLTHIRMEERGIVFNFDNSLGYAILLIAKHRNKILETAVENFMEQFSKKNIAQLSNLSGLIDTSSFKDTKKLISKFFSSYFVNNV